MKRGGLASATFSTCHLIAVAVSSIVRIDRAFSCPRPFACNITSWYSVTLFRAGDHFTMRHTETDVGFK